MKKDIPQYKVEDVAIAIVPREPEDGMEEELWDTFLVNLKEDAIRNVLVNSKGYGEIGGEEKETTILRHYFVEVGPKRCVQIEPIQPKVFELTNEYWVSFQHDGYMYDKKYVFVKGAISENHFTSIPFMNQRGVMIR